MRKSEQMKTGVRDGIRDYVKRYWKLIVGSLFAAVVCFGFLVFRGNIRIDTEELINNPGSKLGWLTIGRYGLAFLKSILGLETHSVLKSGILFFLFFWLGANLLTFAIWHYSKRKEYPYWIFLLLYITSNIWSYQIYFSVQQAEVACAMLLLVVAAMLAFTVFFEAGGVACAWRLVVSIVLQVLGLGAYQALAAYYVAICIVFFLAWLDGTRGLECSGEDDKKAQNRKMLCGILGLVVTFGIAYVIYRAVANTWFMTTADYMDAQMGWGRYPVVDCVKNVLRTAKNLLLSNGPRNFSFYAAGVLLAVVLVVIRWKESKKRTEKKDMRFWLEILALIGLVVSPLLMTIYMGEMLVTRSQFALPLAAAFLGMYAIDGIFGSAKDGGAHAQGAKKTARNRWTLRLCILCVVLVIAGQCVYNLRLAYTDEQRLQNDAAKTDVLLAMLCEVNDGKLPMQPVVFVGYQEVELTDACRRTEMYGWSFYEWDYSEDNPTGATHRIVGFVQAYTGNVLNENATQEQKQCAVELAKGLSDFPEEGSVAVTEDVVVVRLSAVRELSELDWW